MSGFHMGYPFMLLALLIVPAAILWRMWRGRAPVRLVPYAALWSAGGGGPSRWWIAAFYGALALMTIALARPQQADMVEKVEQQGYDLMLAVDLSSSMLSEDYQGPRGRINRLETARPIIQEFVAKRPDDRIGIAVFSRSAMTLAPLTTDHRWIGKQVATLRTGLLEDGTAIGDGLGVALNDIEYGRRNEGQDAQGSVGAFIILLTDGSNNSGDLTPAEATALARHRKIPIYAIGTGRNGMVPYPVFDATGRRVGTTQQRSALDIDALETMAAQTGGRFFMADDTAALKAAFGAIDKARKAQFHVRRTARVRELFMWFALPALLLLILAIRGLVRGTRPRAPARLEMA